MEHVFLMPTCSTPYKAEEPEPGPEHRLRMCQLSVAGTAGLSACALEIERGGRSYTVDTLQAIHDDRCPDAELTFILGADTARTVPGWREPERVLALARFSVAEREGIGAEDVLGTLAALGGSLPASPPGELVGAGGPVILEMPRMEISSSMVRRRVAQGEPVEDLVGVAVAGYIRDHGLYREAADMWAR